MDFKKKAKRSKGSVAPDENGHVMNSSFELNVDSDPNLKNNSKMMNTFRNKVGEAQKKSNALTAIVEAKKGVQKWRQYSATKRQLTKSRKANRASHVGNFIGLLNTTSKTSPDEEEESGVKGQGLDDIDHRIVEPLNMGAKKNNTLMASQTKALFDHFKELGRTKNPDAILDLEFVEALLRNGANINCADRHGQTLLHEVARLWHIDVAKYLLDHGADINHPDYLGRTPLHVSAAVDYPEMCELLIDRGADRESKTKGEGQTPLHYAAKNDATKSLRLLIKKKCLFEDVKDYRGRTPLYVAAQLDRSESARVLLENKSKASVRDDNGQVCLSWLIIKMPLVAVEALNQFWTCDRPNRKQYYDLHHLVHDQKIDPELIAINPLSAAVQYKQFDLLMNKTFTKLVNTMWAQFGRWRAWLNLFLNFVYILLWSLIGIFIEFDKRHEYIMPQHWWRIVLWVAAIAFTAWQITEEVLEYKRSRRKHYLGKKKRTKEIEDDLQYCHKRWPEEEAFLRSELEEINEGDPSYFSDFWNIFDWTCYIFLLVCISTHLADIIKHNTEVARTHIRFMAVTIILLWLRLMKVVRCFQLLGPFIVMLTHMIKDLLRFTFLYLEFYIPFVFAFFMIFGGDKIAYNSGSGAAENVTVQGYEDFNNVLFSIFRLTMVDDYDFDGMSSVDPIMAKLLVGFWLALSAVLCLNLFIALLSDTFQRVYDNAQANAMMQKAQTIMSFWEGMSHNSRKKFLTYIRENCSPLKQYYDDDMTEEDEEDLKKVTIQIKEQLDDLEEKFENKLFSPKDDEYEPGSKKTVSVEKFDNDVEDLRKNLRELQGRQDEMNNTVQSIRRLLLRMLGEDETADDDDDDDNGDDGHGGGNDDSQQRRSKSRSKPKKKDRRQRSRTPSSYLEGSVRDTLQQSGLSTHQAWSTDPVVDVSTPRFSSSRQFPGQDPTTEC